MRFCMVTEVSSQHFPNYDQVAHVPVQSDEGHSHSHEEPPFFDPARIKANVAKALFQAGLTPLVADDTSFLDGVALSANNFVSREPSDKEDKVDEALQTASEKQAGKSKTKKASSPKKITVVSASKAPETRGSSLNKTATGIMHSLMYRGSFITPRPDQVETLLEEGATLWEFRLQSTVIFPEALAKIRFYFPNLRSLSLTCSSCKGNLFESLSQFQNLTSLEIRNNVGLSLDDFSQLAKLTSLESLTLVDLEISDQELEPLFQAFEKLTHLNISNCNITGEVFAHLQSKNLQTLKLADNASLTDCIWPHLEKFTQLRNLDLERCRALENPKWSYLRALPLLNFLQVSHLSMSDEDILFLMPAANSLQSLHFAGGITDRGAALLGFFPNLKRLIFGNKDKSYKSELTDAALGSFALLAKLEVLSIRGCPNISGTGLERVINMNSLKHFTYYGKVQKNKKMAEALRGKRKDLALAWFTE